MSKNNHFSYHNCAIFGVRQFWHANPLPAVLRHWTKFNFRQRRMAFRGNGNWEPNCICITKGSRVRKFHGGHKIEFCTGWEYGIGYINFVVVVDYEGQTTISGALEKQGLIDRKVLKYGWNFFGGLKHSKKNQWNFSCPKLWSIKFLAHEKGWNKLEYAQSSHKSVWRS